MRALPGPEASTSAMRATAALDALRRVEVPAGRASFFATEIPVPTRGQRRQAYLTLELLPAALRCEDRLGSLGDVIAGSARKVGRADRSRVLANLVDVCAHLADAVVLRADLLEEALAELTVEDRLLQPANGAPRVLVGAPSGSALFVETHPARKDGGTQDAWLNGRLVGLFAVGRHVPGFAGVLVFTVRSRRPLHVASLRERHGLGGCAACREVTR